MSRYHHHTDQELLQLLLESDQLAFELIYRKYVSGLYRYTRKNISDKKDCEEIIQDVFEILWARRATLNIQTSLHAYLLGIVRHKIIGYFRKSAQKRKYTEHFLSFEAAYTALQASEADNTVIQSTLNEIIQELPDRCQEALRLRLAEDLSNPDIAKRMNISIRTVEAYMFRAFNHIRRVYKHRINHV